jgi:hypothetical protein
MPSSYSPLLGFELPADGEQAGTWGQTTNKNIGALIEQAIAGVVGITLADANYTLTDFNGVEDESRHAVIVASGILSANRNIIAPANEKTYIVTNNTTGGFSVVIKTSVGTGVEVRSGQTVTVYCNGTEFTLSGVPPVSPAFTGVPTAPTAAPGTSTTQLATTQFVTLADAVVLAAAIAASAEPVGVIKAWFGTDTTVPAGWRICDGTGGTPDLRNRTLVGAGGLYGLGATGGSADAIVVSHTHTGTVDSNGAHTHLIGQVNATGIYANVGGSGPNVSSSGNLSTNSAGAHTHTFTTNSTGSSGTNANLPPYYALFWIMKV